MRRGEIWWASLPEPHGPMPEYRRPVLIVQIDAFNDSSIQTVVVVPITSNLRLGQAPGNVEMQPAQTGLPKPSVANVSQVTVLDKQFLAERVYELPIKLLQRVENGLRLVMGL